MNYPYLFFDLDDTLFDFEASEKAAFANLADELGFDASRFYGLYHQVNLGCWKEMERGKLTMAEIGEERFRRFLPLIGKENSPTSVNERFLDFLSTEGIVYPGVRELLGGLRERGHKLYVASNGIARVQNGRFDASGMRDEFDGIFNSEEIGYPKPDKRFFEAMFRSLSITDKSQCAMIGDSLTSDMLGGRNAGIHTIWYNPKNEKNLAETKPDEEIRSLTELLHL